LPGEFQIPQRIRVFAVTHFVQFKQRDRRLQMLITKLVVNQLHAAGRNQVHNSENRADK
jgi:hypothetical protein